MKKVVFLVIILFITEISFAKTITFISQYFEFCNYQCIGPYTNIMYNLPDTWDLGGTGYYEVEVYEDDIWLWIVDPGPHEIIGDSFGTGNGSFTLLYKITFTSGSSFTPSVTAGNTDQVIGRFEITGHYTDASLTSASIKLNGVRTGMSNVKLWSSEYPFLVTATQLGSTVSSDPGNGNSASFSSFSSWIMSRIYYFVTADVAADATGEVQGIIVQNSSLTISGGSLSGSISNAVLSNGSATLPVELSAFTAQFIENTPTLYWETQSEEDNLGWNIYRNVEEDFSSSEMLTEEMIPGNGTTTEPSYYNYEDRIQNPEVGSTYYYWLESIDYSGISQVYSRVAQITIPDPSVNPPNIEPPIAYDFKNVPNPVNGSTNFRFTLDKSSMVSVSIYNILGELVQTFPTVLTKPDEVSHIYWNGKDSNGKTLTPGVYFYNLIVNGKTEATKKLILMK